MSFPVAISTLSQGCWICCPEHYKACMAIPAQLSLSGGCLQLALGRRLIR